VPDIVRHVADDGVVEIPQHEPDAFGETIKETINRKRIYPPANGTREDILAAAAPLVQAPPQYSAPTAAWTLAVLSTPRIKCVTQAIASLREVT